MLILAEAAGFEAFVGRLHPLLLHFPIALLIFAALLETGRWVIGKREHASISAATCLVFGTLLCVLTVWAGWELAEHESETGQLVEWHRWTAIATLALAVLATVALGLRRWKGPQWTGAHVGLLLLSGVMVAVSGHFGAEMVWGPGWVLEPLRAADPSGAADPSPQTPSDLPSIDADPPVQETSIGWSDVEPIFANHCEKCHGPKRQKAGLQLVPWSVMFSGEMGDWVVSPGDPSTSLLHTLITLPATHDDVMPPTGKADPLSGAQIKLITDWISAGAPGPQGQTPPQPDADAETAGA